MSQAKIPEKLNMQDIVTLTARLAQLLAEEVDQLKAMRLEKIRELQEEKQYLTQALEAHRRLLDKHPHLAETIPSRDRADLEGVVTVFQDILQENRRRLLMAREVNHRIVQAVTDVVREAAMSRVYDGRGAAGALGSDALSLTLNQTA